MKFINRVTAVIFCVFVFCLIYFNQADIMALAQHSLSHGKTIYRPFIGAVIITVVLYLIQRVIYYFFRIDGKWHVLTYLPSFIVLIVVIDIATSCTIATSCWHLLITIPLFFLGAFVILKLIYQHTNSRWKTSTSKDSGFKDMFINLLMLTIAFIIVLFSSNTSWPDHNAFHQRLTDVNKQREIEKAEKEQAERDSLRQIFIADSIIAAKDSIRKEKLRRDSLADIRPYR